MREIEISEKAARLIDRHDRWWRKHRPYAPSLFERELSKAFAMIASNPSIGVAGRPAGTLRRLLMCNTRYHVFYVVAAECIQITSVWSAVRQRGQRR